MSDEEQGRNITQIHDQPHKSSSKWTTVVVIAAILGIGAVVTIGMKQRQKQQKTHVSSNLASATQTPSQPPSNIPKAESGPKSKVQPDATDTETTKQSPDVMTEEPLLISGDSNFGFQAPGQSHESLVGKGLSTLQGMNKQSLMAIVPMATMLFPMLKTALLTLPLYGTVMVGAVVGIYLLYDYFIPNTKKTGLIDSFKEMTLFPRLMMIGLLGVFGWAAYMFASPILGPMVVNILNMVVAR